MKQLKSLLFLSFLMLAGCARQHESAAYKIVFAPTDANGRAPASGEDFSIAFGHNFSQQAKFRLVPYQNPMGINGVNVVYIEERTLLPDTERVLLYGRDLDGDQHPELWFYRQGPYITRAFHYDTEHLKKRAANFRSSREVIADLVANVVTLEYENYLKVAYLGVASFFLISVSEALEAHEVYALTQVDLFSLKFHVDQNKTNMSTQESVGQESVYFEALIERGLAENAAMLETKSGGKSYWAMGVVDVALTVTFLKAGQFIGKGARWVAVKTGSMKYVTTVSKSVTGFAGSLMSKLGFSGPVIKWEGLYLVQNVFRMGLEQIKVHAAKSLRFLRSKGQLQTKVLDTLKKVVEVYKRGLFENWKYVVQTQFVQILAEAYTRRKEIYDPNPLVMAKNLFTNKEFLQNLAYMSHETILMAGIASGNGSLKRKIFLTGGVAFADSTAMNIFIKGPDADPNRMALDTGWEVVVGNLQTQLDITALKYFEQLAVTKKNPKLRLLGYGIALVDQFVGYAAYSTATDKVSDQREQKLELKMIPVVAKTE